MSLLAADNVLRPLPGRLRGVNQPVISFRHVFSTPYSTLLAGKRRRRRAKSDGLDMRQLGSMLSRYAHGERAVWRVVHVPAVDAEAQRYQLGTW